MLTVWRQIVAWARSLFGDDQFTARVVVEEHHVTWTFTFDRARYVELQAAEGPTPEKSGG